MIAVGPAPLYGEDPLLLLIIIVGVDVLINTSPAPKSLSQFDAIFLCCIVPLPVVHPPTSPWLRTMSGGALWVCFPSLYTAQRHSKLTRVQIKNSHRLDCR